MHGRRRTIVFQGRKRVGQPKQKNLAEKPSTDKKGLIPSEGIRKTLRSTWAGRGVEGSGRDASIN